MVLVSIREAKTKLSKLIAEAARGDSFVITKSGKPLVKVVAMKAPSSGKVRRLGFLSHQLKVPDDFDRMSMEKISRLFGTC